MPMRSHPCSTWGSLLALALLSGCAHYNGYGLDPGLATADDVRRTMGEPFRVCPRAGVGETWVYPRGPAGFDTFDVHIDKSGKLAGIENVLNEQGFSKLERGKSTRDDVLCIYGPPYLEAYNSLRREMVWDYRFKDIWLYPSRFYVMFDDGGIVTWTMAQREPSGGGGPEKN